MNKDELIKYALIAAGAYLVYKWLVQPGGFLDARNSAAAQIPGGTSTGAGAGAGTGSGAADPAVAAAAQKAKDEAEYANALKIVQDYTKTGYTAEQLGQIEQWFYDLATGYQENNGNMTGFANYTATVLPAAATGAKTSSPSDEDLKNAAYDSSQANLTGSYKMSGHQWNWYRAEKARAAGAFDASKHQPNIAGMDQQMTATEYHALLASNGISGVSYGWGAPVGMGGLPN